MSAVWRSIALGLMLACVARAAHAADTPLFRSPSATRLTASRCGDAAPDPVLDALIAEVLERNPAQERALPDPLISVALIEAADPLSAPGARDVTRPALLWSQELRAQLGLRAATVRAYYGLLLARERLELVREQIDVWQRVESASRARYAVGLGAQQDVLRSQLEVTRAEERRAWQEAEAEIRQAEINRLRERPLDTPIEAPARLSLCTSSDEAAPLWERVRTTSPELWAMQVALQQARLAVRVAQQAPRPAATRGRAAVAKPRMAPGEAGMALPLQGKGGAAYYEARLRATVRRAEDLEMQLRYRTHERLTQLRTMERIVQLFDQGIIPQGRMSIESALASYQAGKVPFVAVLDALGTHYDDRSRYLGLLNDHAVMRARLEEARLDSGGSMGAMSGAAEHASGAGDSGAATVAPMGSK